MTDSLVSRVTELTSDAQGLSNEKRTSLFVEQAKEIAEENTGVLFSEYSIPLSGQKGYGLVIPPSNGISENTEYLMLGAHLDSVPSLWNAIGKHRPGANDNGFAAAFNIAYAERIANERGNKGVIIGGFPHEEGPGMYRLVFQTALSTLAGIGTEVALGPTLYEFGVPSLATFLLGYFSSLQAYDVIGGVLKPGLAGASRPFKNLLTREFDLNLDQIVHAFNIDMIGTSDSITEIANPYLSPTVNPGNWLHPTSMDMGLASELECMMLLEFSKTQSHIDKILFNHHLLLGTSDHAEIAKYLKSVASFIHINNWRDIHTSRDKVENLTPENAVLYMKMLERFRTDIGQNWRDVSDISKLQNKGLISEKDVGVTMYEHENIQFALFRRAGSSDFNPLNILYTANRDSEERNRFHMDAMLTYGIQDTPEEFMSSVGLSHLKNKKYQEEIQLINEEKSQRYLLPQSMIKPKTYRIGKEIANGLADRSLFVLAVGLTGSAMALYNSVSPGIGPSAHIINEANEMLKYASSRSEELGSTLGIAESVLKELPKLGVLGVGSGALLHVLMRTVPYVKRELRKLNVHTGNLQTDYVLAE